MEAPKSISLLDQRRAQNGGIALARLRMKWSEAAEALWAMDFNVLDKDKAERLLVVLPTSEEIALLREYDGDVALLDKLDSFMNDVCAQVVVSASYRLHTTQRKVVGIPGI